jgi:hypothetical protein
MKESDLVFKIVRPVVTFDKIHSKTVSILFIVIFWQVA